MSIIQVENLKKSFTTKKGPLFRRKKEQVKAVDDISFAIEPGEIFSLLGPNGAGKTTTIKVLATLLIPDSGTARVKGFDVARDDLAVRKITFYFMGKGLAGTAQQGLSNFERLAQTGDYAAFLILGNLVWLFININLWMGGLSLQRDRMLGTFDTHWTMPASKISLVLGSTLASIVLNFFPLVIGISFYSVIGAFRVSANYFSVLFTIVLIMPFLIGFLLIFAALTVRLRQAGMSVHITRAVLSILCGLQFPLAVLPESVSSVGKYIPLTHFVDMIRGIIIHQQSLFAFRDSIIYIALSGILMLIIGVLVFELTTRNVRSRGLVAGY